jgi:hypothetical protein
MKAFFLFELRALRFLDPPRPCSYPGITDEVTELQRGQ